MKAKLAGCWQWKSFPSCSQAAEVTLCLWLLCTSLIPLKGRAKHDYDKVVISTGHSVICTELVAEQLPVFMIFSDL